MYEEFSRCLPGFLPSASSTGAKVCVCVCVCVHCDNACLVIKINKNDMGIGPAGSL